MKSQQLQPSVSSGISQAVTTMLHKELQPFLYAVDGPEEKAQIGIQYTYDQTYIAH